MKKYLWFVLILVAGCSSKEITRDVVSDKRIEVSIPVPAAKADVVLKPVNFDSLKLQSIMDMIPDSAYLMGEAESNHAIFKTKTGVKKDSSGKKSFYTEVEITHDNIDTVISYSDTTSVITVEEKKSFLDYLGYLGIFIIAVLVLVLIIKLKR